MRSVMDGAHFRPLPEAATFKRILRGLVLLRVGERPDFSATCWLKAR
jgi:hypothetical protein